MAANMSGLASLALAIDHLDGVKQQSTSTFQAPTVHEATNNNINPPATKPHSWNMSSSPTRVPLPKPQPYVETRLVSIEREERPLEPLKTITPTTTPEQEEESLDILNQTHNEPPPPPPSPDEVIDQVLENDVLCGRGGETNNHVGNITYRDLVKKYQRVYLKARRRVKPKIARAIVDTIRRKGGRFLKKVPTDHTWRDVGNSKAREKTSQALREGAPELRVYGSTTAKGQVVVQQQQHASPIPQQPQPYYEDQEYKKRKQSPTDMLGTISPDANLVSPTPSSSGSFQEQYVRAVSSADDEEFLSHPPPMKKQKRGPRLAILKARLQDS